MKQSKVAIIHILTTPQCGGASFIGKHLSKEIQNSNYDSYVLFFSDNRDSNLSSNEIILGNLNPRDFRNYFLLRNQINSFKKNYKKIIIHAHLTWPLFFASLIKSSDSVKKVYTEHNTHNKRRKFYLLKYLERIIYNQYDYITLISEGTKNNLEKWLGTKLNPKKHKVIYNGARTFKYSFKKNNKSNKLDIVSIGSLTYQKGFDIAIRSISICRDVVNEYKIYGEGIERKKLEKLIKKLNLNNIVKICGFSSKLSETKLNCNLALIPSRWEGFGLVSIELLSAGIPIIANSVTGLNEVIKNCEAVYLIENFDIKSLSDQIYSYNSRFISNKDLDKKALIYAKNYSLEKMTQKYKSIYNFL